MVAPMFFLKLKGARMHHSRGSVMRQYFLGKSGSCVVVYLVLLSFLRLGIAADSNAKLLSPLEEKIGQAKILYYEFQFKQSETLLQETITQLQALNPSAAVNSDLSEAYLHLALAQDAQSKTKEMRESIYQSVSYDPSRVLSKGQYSPSIITQFEKAKQKYLLAQAEKPNPLSLNSSDLQKSSNGLAADKSTTKKPFYKTWPFFLILGVVVAGGAAGAAIALGGGGGGGGSGPVTVGGTPQ